jgi:hypothetical protein
VAIIVIQNMIYIFRGGRATMTTIILNTLFELLLIALIIIAAFNEKKLITFEKMLFRKIKKFLGVIR